MAVVEGARTTATAGDLRPAAAKEARIARVRELAAERGLSLSQRFPSQEVALHLVRDGVGVITPVGGTDLDTIEKFLTETEPLDEIEGMLQSEARAALSAYQQIEQVPPESTGPGFPPRN